MYNCPNTLRTILSIYYATSLSDRCRSGIERRIREAAKHFFLMAVPLWPPTFLSLMAVGKKYNFFLNGRPYPPPPLLNGTAVKKLLFLY